MIIRGWMIAVTAIMVYVLFYYFTGNLQYARTGVFVALVMAQLFYVFDCRSEKYSVFEMGIFQNKYLFFAVSLSVVLQVMVVELPLLQEIFHTTSLGMSGWIVVVICSSFGTIGFGIYRYFVKKYQYRGRRKREK